MQIEVQRIGPGMIQQIQSMCSDCRGQGEKINEKDRCKGCSGQKVSKTIDCSVVYVRKC